MRALTEILGAKVRQIEQALHRGEIQPHEHEHLTGLLREMHESIVERAEAKASTISYHTESSSQLTADAAAASAAPAESGSTAPVAPGVASPQLVEDHPFASAPVTVPLPPRQLRALQQGAREPLAPVIDRAALAAFAAHAKTHAGAVRPGDKARLILARGERRGVGTTGSLGRRSGDLESLRAMVCFVRGYYDSE